MNPNHLWAFLWLRWRIRVNQLRKGGIANLVLLILVAIILTGFAVGGVGGAFAAGYLMPPDTPPAVRLLVWDVLVLTFLFVWLTTLMADLQRTDSLSLDKFLHLPVAPVGAFLVNYLSSLLSITAVLFVPALVGLAVGQAYALGPAQLLAVPLVAAFFLALTAVTYQFQGWLAALMSNPRRRRSIIVGMTLGFILLAQAPNLVNILRPWHGVVDHNWLAEQQLKLAQELAAKAITKEQYDKRMTELPQEHKNRMEQSGRQLWDTTQQVSWLTNTALPPGWLPLGAAELAAGNALPALLGTAGLSLIGGFSLWRAYRTTLRIYTGQDSAGDGRPTAAAAPAVKDDRRRMMEWPVPGVSDHAAAVALAGLRSLTRAPEAKMMLLTPVIMIAVFGSLMLSSKAEVSEAFRPLMAFGAVAMGLFSTGQLVANQFGYDRAGFRAFVLSPAPRGDILFGKNLAVAPLALLVCGVAVAFVAVVYPMRADHLLAVPLTAGSMFLLFCMGANLLSIYAPIPIAPGAMQASSFRLVPALLHMAFLLLLPALLAPTLLPLGVEHTLATLGWGRGLPVALVLSAAVFAGVLVLYRFALTWEGDLLVQREKAVLEVVTSKEE